MRDYFALLLLPLLAFAFSWLTTGLTEFLFNFKPVKKAVSDLFVRKNADEHWQGIFNKAHASLAKSLKAQLKMMSLPASFVVIVLVFGFFSFGISNVFAPDKLWWAELFKLYFTSYIILIRFDFKVYAIMILVYLLLFYAFAFYSLFTFRIAGRIRNAHTSAVAHIASLIIITVIFGVALNTLQSYFFNPARLCYNLSLSCLSEKFADYFNLVSFPMLVEIVNYHSGTKIELELFEKEFMTLISLMWVNIILFTMAISTITIYFLSYHIGLWILRTTNWMLEKGYDIDVFQKELSKTLVKVVSFYMTVICFIIAVLFLAVLAVV